MHIYWMVTKNYCFSLGETVESHLKSVSKAPESKMTLENHHGRCDRAGN